MLARAAAKLAEECLPSGAYGSGNANTNDYKAHAGREGLIGEAVVDAARLEATTCTWAWAAPRSRSVC